MVLNMNNMHLIKHKFLKLMFFKNLNKIYDILNKKVKNKTITRNSKVPFFIKYIIKGYEINVLIISKYLINLFSDNEGGIVNQIIYSHHPSLNIIESKSLFGKVIIITPNISKKTIMVFKENKEKPQITVKIKKKEIQKLIHKTNTNKPKINHNNSKKPKNENPKLSKKANPPRTYKLQKKKTAPIAIFSATVAILFTVSIALLSFKKLINKMFVIKPINFFKKKTKSNKILIKK